MGFASGDYGMKYDYGTDLVFGIDDGNGGTVERPCCVVGITTLQTEEQAFIFGHPSGSILYTVEFADGSDLLVHEDLLRPVAPGGSLS